VLNGGGAPRDFYAAWGGRGGKVEYTRFRIYEASYIISISSAIAIAVVCLILWKKESLLRKLGDGIKRLKRLFRLGIGSR